MLAEVFGDHHESRGGLTGQSGSRRQQYARRVVGDGFIVLAPRAQRPRKPVASRASCLSRQPGRHLLHTGRAGSSSSSSSSAAAASTWLAAPPTRPEPESPAGAPVHLDAPAATRVVSLPDPRPRQQVHPQLRHRLRQRRHPDHQDTDTGAERERDRRAFRPHRPRGVPRLAPRHEPAPPRARTPSLRRPPTTLIGRTGHSISSRPIRRPEAAHPAPTHSRRRAPRPTRGLLHEYNHAA